MYEGMTKEAIASAVAQRKEGYMGGLGGCRFLKIFHQIFPVSQEEEISRNLP